MDFFQIAVKEKKGGGLEAYPDFIVGRSEDLMVRAKNFYAIWDEETNLWSTDEYNVQRIVDDKLHSYAKENKDVVGVKPMRSFGSNGQSTFRKFLSQIGDNSHQLDEKLTFLTTKTTKKDYVSKRLPYDLAAGDISAWEEMVSTLYAPEERQKIEWFLGAIVSGDSKDIQKFLVLEGPPGAGKGTIINITMTLFPGYITTFDAKALGTNGNQFAAAAFAGNPLLAIQHDGDLSKIEDNTTLNSIISHEIMKVNEKYKPSYDARINAALMMGTNKPVKITDSQSGMIRRLIDVHPTGNLVPPKRYHALMAQINFELGAIAHHCLGVYKKTGKTFYNGYRPLEMMYKTNAFINYIELHRDLFESQGGVTAKQAWNLYKDYCEEANIDRPMKLMEFRAELGTYFEEFHDRYLLDDVQVRSYYRSLKTHVFKMAIDDASLTFALALDETISLLNLELAELPAQYAKADGSPSKYWDDSERLINGELKRPRPSQIVDTYLRDLDPTKEHYVKVPENHIVIDFDIKDEDGNKSLELNLAAAAEWPPTYGELSKSGSAVHLHYEYTGDVTQLDSQYAEGIEVKVYTGNSALRRRLSKCNNVPIATLSTGLPLKEKKRVLDPDVVINDKTIRKQILANINKEYHPGTKPSIDFIYKILEEAYERGVTYDVSDMRQRVTVFANNSSNRALECLKIVQSMRWKSEPDEMPEEPKPKDDRVVIYDVECYPNMFLVCWKFEEDEPKPENVVVMLNPKPHEVEALFGMKLVGYFNRNYDNHMLWAAALGYNNAQLYNLSQKLISSAAGVKFGEAFRLSWTDILDFSTKKQGLKKWQIELGLEHREMDLDWDQPVPDDRVQDVIDYCVNDVVSTEMVFKHLRGDYTARLILADLAGLSPNDTTARLTASIVFGKEKNPQRSFVYTKLAKEFPGYVFENGKSTYRDEVVGEGGYVYAEPGIYTDVALLDVASMHPTSIGQLNLFGEFTPKFMALVEAQLALKNFDFSRAKDLLDGKLRSYIEEIEALGAVDGSKATSSPEGIKAAADLRWGLKIAINIVYGLTSAKFDNPFKDRENVDNIVAKRGALFMIDLKHELQQRGFTVAHIKTDSVKIPNATPEIIEFVMQFGEKYGYTFEHEATYEKFALLNDAVYVAKDAKKGWTATGSQFHKDVNPYTFKSLFGQKDSIDFYDMCVTKHVQQGDIRLDFGHEGDGYVNNAVDNLKDAEKRKKIAEKDGDPVKVAEAVVGLENANAEYENALDKLIFVGRTGRFTPVLPGNGGGQLYRIKDGKHYAVAGTKGHLWVDSNVAMDLPSEAIDEYYFEKQLDDSKADLEKMLEGTGFDSLEEFLA